MKKLIVTTLIISALCCTVSYADTDIETIDLQSEIETNLTDIETIVRSTGTTSVEDESIHAGYPKTSGFAFIQKCLSADKRQHQPQSQHASLYWEEISVNELRPGDIGICEVNGDPMDIGIYIGTVDGKDLFTHVVTVDGETEAVIEDATFTRYFRPKD